jgi:hypothetical protein
LSAWAADHLSNLVATEAAADVTGPALLHSALSAGPAADPAIIAMMTELGLASVKWLQDRWPAQ